MYVLLEEGCFNGPLFCHFDTDSDYLVRITVHLPQFFHYKQKSLKLFPGVWDPDLYNQFLL